MRIGFGLLLATFVVAFWRIAGWEKRSVASASKTIRLAHWQLETGPRQALDRLIKEYQILHPHVSVEQLAIPARAYPAWLRTQLVGETAPDLVQVGHNVPGLNDLLARYFTPLTDLVVEPNPYNVGTSLEGVPLRDTVIDGMSANMVFVQELQEYYAVPLSIFTVRVFYNRDQWRRLFGDRALPATFEAFSELCAEIGRQPAGDGRTWLPMAGARNNGWLLLNRLYVTQMQKLDVEISAGSLFGSPPHEIGLAYLRGEWNYDSPGPRSGLELMRHASKFMQPGFMQMEPADALFQFLQEHALMILAGSANLRALKENAQFEIGVFELPIPDGADRRFGAHVLGPRSEGSIGAEFPIGVTMNSPNPERAVDFLRFLASQPVNTRFTEESGWLPSIVGVEVAPELAPLRPRLEGVALGFDTRMRSIGPEVNREVMQSAHLLLGPTGDAAATARTLDRVLPAAVRSDLKRQEVARWRASARQDAVIAAHRRLADSNPASQRKLEQMLENQLDMETTAWWIARELEAVSAR